MHVHLPRPVLAAGEVAARHLAVEVLVDVLRVLVLVHEALLARVAVEFVVELRAALDRDALLADERVERELEPGGEAAREAEDDSIYQRLLLLFLFLMVIIINNGRIIVLLLLLIIIII